MKFAVGCVLDQTIGYWNGSGEWATKHPEVKLYDTREEAERLKTLLIGDFIEEVPDEAEFRAREDTW
jgi:hypothetical protein